MTLGYTFVLEPLAKSSIFVVSTPSRKPFSLLSENILFADDAELIVHTEEEMQLIMDIFSRACFAFGLIINLKKTKVMYTTPTSQVYVEPNIITVEGNTLGVMDNVVYLRSTPVENAVLMLNYLEE